jgi:hypothetical protein
MRFGDSVPEIAVDVAFTGFAFDFFHGASFGNQALGDFVVSQLVFGHRVSGDVVWSPVVPACGPGDLLHMHQGHRVAAGIAAPFHGHPVESCRASLCRTPIVPAK